MHVGEGKILEHGGSVHILVEYFSYVQLPTSQKLTTLLPGRNLDAP